MSAAGVVVGGLGFLVGAAAVAGGSLALADGPPREAVQVASGFCDEVATDVAREWDLTVQPQETVAGDRDSLTVCTAASDSGDVRLTLTVLALAEEEGRAEDERTSTMLDLACTALHRDGGAGAAGGDGCDGPVETVDDLVGNASAFVTDDGRALVTVVLTAPPDRAVGTGRDVASLISALSAGVD